MHGSIIRETRENVAFGREAPRGNDELAPILPIGRSIAFSRDKGTAPCTWRMVVNDDDGMLRLIQVSRLRQH
jgi:hypothetical protein